MNRLLALWKLCRRARGHGRHRPPGSVAISYGSDTGFIIAIDGVWHIVIDGSDTVSEWLKNFAWWRIGNHRMAWGFSSVARELIPQIEAVIIQGSPVVLTGHSRGGAIAQAVARIMADRWHNISEIVTFGSPKVGGRRFRNDMTELGLIHTRVDAEGDPVTRLPWLRGRHYETMHVLLKNNIRSGIRTHLSYGEMLRGVD